MYLKMRTEYQGWSRIPLRSVSIVVCFGKASSRRFNSVFGDDLGKASGSGIRLLSNFFLEHGHLNYSPPLVDVRRPQPDYLPLKHYNTKNIGVGQCV